MQATPQRQALDLPLPLMYLAPHRSLSSAYVSTDSLDRFDAVRQAAGALGVTLSLLYTYWDPTQQQFQGTLVLDQTNAHEPADRIAAALAQVPGVTVRAFEKAGTGLAAFEKDRLSVAGTPVAVMARPFLGSMHKLLLQSLGDRAEALLFQAGESAGHQAAAGVPALVASLGLPLTPPLVRERFYDLQVFGWTTVVALQVDDRFTGEARLADTFEATAWNGQATTSTCHWIRGFLTGALSSLTRSALRVSEPDCQGKGDRYCRMTFEAA